MKFRNLKQIAAVAILLVALAAFTTSCNRGVGCPNNFTVEEPVKP